MFLSLDFSHSFYILDQNIAQIHPLTKGNFIDVLYSRSDEAIWHRSYMSWFLACQFAVQRNLITFNLHRGAHLQLLFLSFFKLLFCYFWNNLIWKRPLYGLETWVILYLVKAVYMLWFSLGKILWIPDMRHWWVNI